MRDSNIFNAAVDIDDAVIKKHAQNADTSLGVQTEDLDMGTHKIINVVNPVAAQDVATKAYGDTNWGEGGGGGLTWSVITANTNAVVLHGYLINASGGNVTLTLPAAPTEGNLIGVCDFYDKAAVSIITIARNGKNIEGTAENLIVDVSGAGFTLIYTDETRGWEIITEVSGTSGGGGDLGVVANHSDITSAGAAIEDAVTKKHTQNADTALGTQTENLNMGTHKVEGVVDPTLAQDVVTKAYGDAHYVDSGGSKIIEGNTSIEIIDTGDGHIVITEDGTEIARFTGGEFGIGTTNPEATLHLCKNPVSHPTISTSANNLVIEENGSGGITIISPVDSIGSVYFGDTDDSNVGRIRYHHTDNSLRFTINDMADKVIIDADGALGLKEGTVPSHTAGYGKFYVKSSDSLPYFKTGGGTEYGLAEGSSKWTDEGTYYYPNNWSYMRILDSARLDIADSDAFADGFPWNDVIPYGGSERGSMVNIGQKSSSDGNPPLWVQKKFNKSSGSATHYAGAGLFEVWKQSGSTNSYISALTGNIQQECASGDAIGVHGRSRKHGNGNAYGMWAYAYRPSGQAQGFLHGIEINARNCGNSETFSNTVQAPADIGAWIYPQSSTYPSLCAIGIGADSSTNTHFNGILFNTNSVRNVAGNGVGINMYSITPQYGVKFSSGSTANIYYASTSGGLRLKSLGHTINVNSGSGIWYWRTSDNADDRMRLTHTGNLQIDGTLTENAWTLDKKNMVRKWELMDTILEAYQNHDGNKLDPILQVKNMGKCGKRPSDFIQIAIECIADLKNRIKILENNKKVVDK